MLISLNIIFTELIHGPLICVYLTLQKLTGHKIFWGNINGVFWMDIQGMELRKYWIFRPKIKGLGNCHLSVSFLKFFFFCHEHTGGPISTIKKEETFQTEQQQCWSKFIHILVLNPPHFMLNKRGFIIRINILPTGRCTHNCGVGLDGL